MLHNIYTLFYSAYQQYPQNTCISFGHSRYTYQQVFELADRLAQFLREDAASHVGILAHRTLAGYAGILATLQAGKTYVPLNPKFPPAKLSQIIGLAGINTLVTENESLSLLNELNERSLRILAPELRDEIRLYPTLHQIIDADTINIHKPDHVISEPVGKAYLLFTSGSTGIPKGIEIAHKSVIDYLDFTQQRLNITPEDRCSQIFDLSFDLSVHDLFLTWKNGACLCIPDKTMLLPVKFVHQHELTVWFSVPSVAHYLANNKFLKPGLFPSLRISLFCGEPLIAGSLEKWQEAAPHSYVENIYGPTESTIGISYYVWQRNLVNKERNGVVSIGKIFPTQKYLVLNSNDEPAAPMEPGELLVSGSQVISGYFTPGDHSARFIRHPADSADLYYRTGDIVLEDEDKDLYFLQRKDFEFKIRGYRVEEEEINNILRKITKVQNVVSVPVKGKSGQAETIISFVHSSEEFDERDVIGQCRTMLPDYMVPNKIYFFPDFPLNNNGKIDRGFFAKFLQEESQTQKHVNPVTINN